MDSDVIPPLLPSTAISGWPDGCEPRPVHRQIAFANLFAREFIYPSLPRNFVIFYYYYCYYYPSSLFSLVSERIATAKKFEKADEFRSFRLMGGII